MRLASITLTGVLVLIGLSAAARAQDGQVHVPVDRSKVWPTVPMDSDAQRFSVARFAQLALTPEAGDLDFRVTSHDLLIDVPRGEAVVDLRFSDVPDLQSSDELGRQSHSFQYFVSEPNWSAFFLRSGGEPETVFPLLIVQVRRGSP